MGSGDRQSSTGVHIGLSTVLMRLAMEPIRRDGPRLNPMQLMAMMKSEHSSPALLGPFINLAVPGDIAWSLTVFLLCRNTLTRPR